jgi:hypothetical protein
MTKIVYNTCFGGFGLSDRAIRRYLELRGGEITTETDEYGNTHFFLNGESFDEYDISRADPILARVVEELGSAASGHTAALRIRELPVGTQYCIEEYDGLERVVTIDEYVWSVA